ERRKQIAAVRAARDNGAARRNLETLQATAKGSGNLMPPILACVKAHATVGEICDAMREVFGEYQERLVL
ncbi:MAG: methylmalonyl-CoA mutase, partial [Acidobacteriota bacterium]|nr:methylmalonyl-CoA mutase [Acidobacteriota bacterium]